MCHASYLGVSFEPPRILRHQHLQSMLPSWFLRAWLLRKQAAALLRAARVEVLHCGDGVRLSGYFSAQQGPSHGLVILLHGWEGCADSSYILSTGKTLYEHGFDVFRLNFRDHGNTHALNEELFHSCRIGEVVNAIKAIQLMHATEWTALVGYSLGGNFALRVAARAASAGLSLDRVFAICPVLKPHSTMQALEEGLWVYRHYFLRRWRQSLLAKAVSFPERYDFGDLNRFPTLTATTEFFVHRYTEFPDLDSYLSGYAITGEVLADLAVPSRLILASDDPVIPIRDRVALIASQALDVSVVPYGGHCGFLDGYLLGSWVDKEIIRSFEPTS